MKQLREVLRIDVDMHEAITEIDAGNQSPKGSAYRSGPRTQKSRCPTSDSAVPHPGHPCTMRPERTRSATRP